MAHQPQPKSTDAVLGNSAAPTPGSAVLGGMAGIQARFTSPHETDRLAVLRELKTRHSPEAEILMLQALTDASIAVQKLAYRYLSEQQDETAEIALATYPHYRLFEPLTTLTGHTQGITAVTTGIRQFLHRPAQPIAISSDRLGHVKVWDLDTQEATLSFQTWSFAYGLHYDVDRDYIWIRTAQDHLLAWSLRTQQEVDWQEDQTLELPTQALPTISQIASVLKIDDRYLIGGNQRNIKIWDLKQANEVKILEGHRRLVNALAITDDRDLIISGSEDCTVKLWGIT